MKLYATTTSERASKGQGGNEYLDIDIMAGSRSNPQYLARFTARPTEYGYALFDENDIEIRRIVDEKGEKQKGECDGRHTSVQAILDCHICNNDPLIS